MKTTRLLPAIATVLLLAVMVLVPVPASADGPAQSGTINGTLVNHGSSGASIGNVSITLITYQNGTEQGRSSATSDDQGHFQFTNLATSSDYDYGLTVQFQDAEYMTDFQQFDQGATSMDWQVPVYDTTSDGSQIRISRGHLIVDVSANSLTVLEFFSFTNSGDKTFVGSHPITTDGRKETLKLSLPPAATQITAQEGLDECCAFRTDQGISDTLAVPPGDRSIVFSYQLPVSSSSLNLDLPLYYPVDSINLFVTDQAAKVSSPQLQPQDPVDMGGQKYQHLVGNNLPANTDLSVGLTNLGGNNGLSGLVTPTNMRWGGMGAAVLAIGVVLFFGLRRRQPALATAATSTSQHPAEREVLLRELAELDDRFASGQLGDDDYERLREEKKQKLKDLMASGDDDPEDELEED